MDGGWTHAPPSSEVARELALFTAVEGRVVEEGAGGAAPLSALIVLLLARRLHHATSHIYDGGQKTRCHGDHDECTCSPDRGPHPAPSPLAVQQRRSWLLQLQLGQDAVRRASPLTSTGEARLTGCTRAGFCNILRHDQHGMCDFTNR